MTGGHPLVLHPVNDTAPVPRRHRAGLGGQVVADATIPVLIDACKRRSKVSERELLTNAAAVYERAKGGDRRDGAAMIVEG